MGYSTGDYAGKNWACVTFGFTSVGSDTATFKMSDIKADNFADDADTLQFLEPTSARSEKFYFSYDGDWYENTDDWNEANDDTFDMGTGFLGNLASGSVSLTCSGQVLEGPTQLDLSGKNWVMIGNPLPRAVKFSEIEAIDFADDADTLQKLESSSARSEKFYFCYDGDWYENTDDWNDASDDEIAAGEALLANVASGSVKINFPSAL